MVLGNHIQMLVVFIEAPFGFGWWDVSDRPEEAALVEPIHPFQGLPFYRVRRLPGPEAMDDLGLKQADDRLSERVIVAITDAADGGLQPGLGKALGIAQR